MADKAVNVYVGKQFHQAGQCVNVYDTYAHALAHAATGLMTISSVDKTVGTAGTAITQAAKTVGAAVDENGFCQFIVDNGAAVFLKLPGAHTPQYVPTTQMF